MIGRFLRNAGYSATGQAALVISGIGQSIILARVLGPEGRGILALVVLLPATVHAVVASGFPAAVVHSVASGRWGDEDVLPRVLGIWVYLSLVMIAVALVALGFHETLLPGASRALLAAGLALMPLMLLDACLVCVLSGKQSFRRQMIVRVASSVLSLMGVALFVGLFRWGIPGALTAQYVALVAAILLSHVAVTRTLSRNGGRSLPDMRWSSLTDSLGFGGKAHLANVATYLNYRADQFLVNGMLGSAGLGLYTVAVNNAEKLWLMVGNFAAVLFPMASGAEDDPAVMARFSARLSAAVLCVTAAVGIVLAVLAEPIVVLLYGRDFAPAGRVIVFLIPGIVLLGHAKITANYMAGRGRPGINAAISGAALMVNVAANILLIPRFGLIGAALATSLSYAMAAVATGICFVRITGQPWLSVLVPARTDLSKAWSRIRAS